MNSLLELIKKYIYDFNIREAYLIDKKDITLKVKDEEDSTKQYIYEVNYENLLAHVKLVFDEGKLTSFGCSCRSFSAIHSCLHIPAVIINYGNDLVKLSRSDIKSISKRIILDMANMKKNYIRQELNVKYDLEFSSYYYNKSLELKIKIGTTKLYSLGQKMGNFKLAYINQDREVYFGKDFTYNPDLYYFNPEDEKIIEYILNRYENNNLLFYDNEMVPILKLLHNREFYVDGILIKGIIDGLPFNIKLNKDKDNYVLDFDYQEITPILNDFRYIIANNKIYYLDKDKANLLKTLNSNNLKELVFSKDELNNFSKGILAIIKKDLIIDENISEIGLLNTEDVKLYFDFNQDSITCKVKLIYNNVEVDYFKKTNDIIRDIDFENQVIEDLKSCNFIVENNKITLSEIDDIVDFLDNGLSNLTNKYQVFTSEKIKNTNIIKKPKVQSNFAIGSDNIMHYDFQVQDVDSKELDKLLSSLRKKKKYYRLKNGNIIDLNNEDLDSLNDLVDDLNINLKEQDSSGVIPKYQAIYLDYLKKEKYPNLETNNLFDDFINNFKKYNNIKLDIKDNILRGYQKEGVKWLYTIYKCDLGGILADEMGLGKTIQSIYLMKELIKEDKRAKFLVVCPTALVYNWATEFDLYGKEISYKIIHGSNRIKEIENVEEQVIITSYGTLREDIEKYDNLTFKAMFIDEAQNIKNPVALISKAVKNVKASTKYALTGTPLENSIVELWSIFDFIMPGFLGNLTKFNLKYHFHEGDDSYNEKIEKLKNVTSPFIMRRKKSDVIKELPEKVENNIYIDLGEKQKLLYKKVVEEVREEVANILSANDFNSSRTKIIVLLTRLRQLCIDPHLIFENYDGESTKIDNLVEIVKEIVSNNHKILIFTSFKSALEIVKEKFRQAGITFYTIDGSVSAKNRKELVDKFNNDKTNTFLITIKSGGTGLNLTSADVVIHLDLWWNPQVENQATDRAHRIGQTKVVEVIKLITKGTIEEKILELQKKKQKLSDDLIEKNKVNDVELASLTEKDIKNLLDLDN